MQTALPLIDYWWMLLIIIVIAVHQWIQNRKTVLRRIPRALLLRKNVIRKRTKPALLSKSWRRSALARLSLI